jgi:transcription initiation factor TFIIIB Brf1 subunit/transcription initiation factor TFIIB
MCESTTQRDIVIAGGGFTGSVAARTLSNRGCDMNVLEVRNFIETGTAQNLHSGGSPAVLAAGAVYAASRLRHDTRTQAAVSEIFDVSRATVHNRYQDLLTTHVNGVR